MSVNTQERESATADSPDEARQKSGAKAGYFSPRQLWTSLPSALKKLDPRHLARNPVMFVVLIGAAITTVYAVASPSVFTWLTTLWLWFTVIFANLAESVAEGRGKAQAASLRQVKRDTIAHRLVAGEPLSSTVTEEISGTDLKVGDRVVVIAGQVIPGDGDVIEGIATVDESAITGESAPVIRESGGDRCAVTGGTNVLSDRIVVQITAAPGESFVDRMIALVEGASRQKTPNEIALNILLASLTIIFLLAVIAIGPMGQYGGQSQDPVKLIALLVCLIPTTIGALLSAIGIAGMDRLVQRNVLAMSGRAVEAAGDIDTLLMDKTGTITFGNRQATALHPAPGVSAEALAAASRLSSLADGTPEGRSIIDLVARDFGLDTNPTDDEKSAEFVPFTAQTRMSGLDTSATSVRKGASSNVFDWVAELGGTVDAAVHATVDSISQGGGTPLVVASSEAGSGRILGVIALSDVVKPHIAERFAELRAMGIKTVMITGDNPLTAAAIAAEAGVDDFMAEASPEDKLALIRKEQEGGRLVAMNTGTSAAKEAGNMVDLDSDPTKLIEIVEIGKQLLITRGALTTFSLANDLAKYFAILPALFSGIYPQLDTLNIMRLSTPESAILSAVIFNALVIVALIPLALKGVRYRPSTASALLGRNLLLYGVGGVVTPFVGIWLIDLAVRHIPGIG